MKVENALLLDICIPTHNRFEWLKHNLNKIATVVDSSPNVKKVRVLVSNNASTDDTTSYLSDMKKKFNFIKTYNQIENIGFSMNLKFLWNSSRSEYIWTISDDDFYSQELINSIIDITCSGPTNIPIIINSFHFLQKNPSSDISIIRPNMLNLDEKYNFLKYKNGLRELVTKENFTAFGLLGSTVFPRTAVKDFILNLKLIKNNYPHQLLLFKALSSHELIVLNYKGGLGWRAQDSNWSLTNIDMSFQAHYLDYLEVLKNCNFCSYRLRRDLYKLIYLNSYKASMIFLLKHKKSVIWVLKTFFINHLRYTYFSVTYDFLLLIASIFKWNFFNTFLLNFFDRRQPQA